MNMLKTLCALTCFGAVAAATPVQAQSAAADSYPTRSIRLVVPFGPGGPTDIAARMVSQKLAEALGQSVVVENKPGAGGSIGSAEVARAAPDGYTLLYGSSSTLAVNPSLYPKLPYDPLTAFVPVAMVAKGPQVMIISTSLPAGNLQEFVDYARKNPAKISFSSAGIGSIGHLSSELLLDTLGIKAVHVPYKSGALAIAAVAQGETQFTVDAVGTTASFVKSGKVKAVALLSDKASAFAPGIPTVQDAGFKTVAADFWSGIVAPAGTSPAIVKRLNAEVVKILAQPDVKAQMQTLGAETQASSPADFARFVDEEVKKWSRVVRMTGATAN